MPKRLTYRAAGVNIAAGEALVERIKPLAAATKRPEIVSGIGGFAALFRVPRGYRRPLLATSTDGVGTKLRIAFLLNRHDTVGIDLVAMSVNDVLTLGAEPIAFLDYLATSHLDPKVASTVLRGVAEGCRQAGCALVGGETAEMPSFYADGEYDLAGFVVGVVESRAVVDGRRIRPGDVLIGLPSTGLHSNGFSLVRKILFDDAKLSVRDELDGVPGSIGEILLNPTKIYVREVLKVVRRHAVKGMVHVTGGGLLGNVPRVLPRGCQARIHRGAWTVPPLFGALQKLGGLSEREMFQTFNMGVGYVLIAGRREAPRILSRFEKMEQSAFAIGEIHAGRTGARLV